MTLREARKRKGYTQMELASLVGVSAISLCYIENYKVVPQAETKRKIREVLGDVEFYPVSVLEGMLYRCISSDRKLAPQRGDFLKGYIDEVVQDILTSNCHKFKTIKS